MRFSRVDTSLFRGGAPTPEHLRQLKELGVTTIVDLRRESPGSRRAEELEAHELGLRYVAYPFFGVFGADTHFLDDLIATLATRSEGAVYVHCDDGRERTSLAVALFRVVAQGWAPDDAWVTEAQAYGARRTGMFREIELTFRDHVHQHQVRSRS